MKKGMSWVVFYSLKQPGEKINETVGRYRASIHTFDKKGVELEHLIDKQKFSILVFKKISFSMQNYVSMANGDFILATGTLIYKGAIIPTIRLRCCRVPGYAFARH